MKLTINSLILIVAVLGQSTASAHLSYAGDLGSYSEGTYNSNSVTTNSSGDYGWADGSDVNYGDSHRLKLVRFSLSIPTTVTISTSSATAFLPAFSLYLGLAHSGADAKDHDPSASSLAYLDTLPGGMNAYEGSFNALGNWAIGNDTGNLSYFTYIGNAADGVSANYGTASGIIGDGVANHFVTAQFLNLAAGDYTLFIGGANYYSSANTPNLRTQAAISPYGGAYSFTTNVTAVPEPSTYALILAAGGLFRGLRRRKMVS